jgi:exportin-5
VIVLQTLNSIRKRDIQTTLLQHGNKLIEFIEYFLDFSNTISSALYALTMFATFLPIEIFFSTKIIEKIVVLLNSPIHRMKASEFFSVIADRRGKYEERLPLLQLFSYLFQNGSHYNDLFSAIQIKQSNDIYDFMKQYAMVLTALSDQLCYLCGGEDLNKKSPLPEQFSNGTFLQVLLSLMQHPSIYISLYGYQMWLQLIKANIFQENDYQNILPVVLRALCHSLVKQPYTKKDNQSGRQFDEYVRNLKLKILGILSDIASYYIHYDFEDESDYQKFIGKNRTILVRSVNSVCKTSEHLSIAIRIGFDYADYCFQSINLPLFESLVAYWQIIEKHLRTLLKSGESFNNSKYLSDQDELSFCQRGQTLIEQLLLINNDNNLEFLAYSIRLLTCLYVFTRGEQTWTQRILEHLFRTITTERELSSKSNPLQKQASCLIDLCLNYGRSIFIYFNDLFKVTENLVRQQTSSDQQMKLAGWQWSILVECLAILLNHFQSFQQQAILINQLVQPFADILTKFNSHVNDLETFIDYLGLKITPDGTPISNQRLVILSVHILCGFLRRITLPTDPKICSNGDYQETFDGIVFIRNPASPAFIQLTPYLFKLLTYCHSLHSPNSPLIQSSYSFLLTMTDAEKAVYLQQENNEDIQMISSIQTNSLGLTANHRRLHNRFSSFFDRLQILIGTYLTLKPDLYKLKDSLNIIGTSLFSSLDYLPEFRLRNIIRYCFLPFARHCPIQTIHIAIFESLLPFMYTKLKNKWKIITERQSIKVTNGNVHENNEDNYQTQDRCEEEVIEEQVRILSIGKKEKLHSSLLGNMLFNT